MSLEPISHPAIPNLYGKKAQLHVQIFELFLSCLQW